MRRSRPQPPPVYPIADAEALAPREVVDAAEEMADAGARWIQVRGKRLEDRELFRQVEGCCRRLEGSGVALWVDDRADVAALLPVAGVHLGQADLPPAAARRVVGEEKWIGWSTHDEAQLRAGDDDPDVDVIAIGPIFPTTGKRRPDPVVGLPALARLRRRTAKPLVAIGGIDAERLQAVLGAGADSAAVIGAACRGDVADNLRALLAAAGEVS